MTPLAFSSAESGIEPAPAWFDPRRQWTADDFGQKELVIGAALEGRLAGDARARMVVFSDGDFAVGDDARGQVNEDNVNLLTNSIDWLTDASGLIDLRTKQVTSRPIDEMEDGKKAFLKWFNFLMPIVLIILIGIYRWQQQRFRRIRRMQVDYVR